MYQLCKSCFHVKIDPRRGVSVKSRTGLITNNYWRCLQHCVGFFFVPFSLVNSHCWFAGKTRNTNERCYGDIMPLWQGWQELRMTFMHSWQNAHRVQLVGTVWSWNVLAQVVLFIRKRLLLPIPLRTFHPPPPPPPLLRPLQPDCHAWTSLWTPDKTGNTYFSVFEDMVLSLDSELTKWINFIFLALSLIYNFLIINWNPHFI